MKNEIHPEYFNAEVSCVCGHKYNTGATQKEIKVEICFLQQTQPPIEKSL